MVIKKSREKIVILKIGGSIVTQKNRSGVFIRRVLLNRIAQEIRDVLKKDKNLRLIIVHGAGSAGHQLAKKYSLAEGVGGDAKKMKGALLICAEIQKLNVAVTRIFTEAGLTVSPVHTSSVIVQKKGVLDVCEHSAIDEVLHNDCIPLLYGDMVFDTKLGMSICSGDAIATHLALVYGASKIIYASDIDGLYDKDPHKYKEAQFVRKISIHDIDTIQLSDSHNIDVTGGIKNKILSVNKKSNLSKLKKIIIFNGFRRGNFSQVLMGGDVGTSIEI